MKKYILLALFNIFFLKSMKHTCDSDRIVQIFEKLEQLDNEELKLKALEAKKSNNKNATISQSVSLHTLVKNFNPNDKQSLNIFKKESILLLQTNPTIINALNHKNRTALDQIYRFYIGGDVSYQKDKRLTEIINFLREKGAKTINELNNDNREKRKNEQNNAKTNCIICLAIKKQMINIPCPAIHTSQICQTCFILLLEKEAKCPLCRTNLTIKK